MENNIEIITNISSKKKIYNLSNGKCKLLNECKDEIIDVEEIMIKIINDKENNYFKALTFLIDKKGNNFITGSVFFYNQLKDYIDLFGIDTIKSEGFKIKIIEKNLSKSKNKALGFELVE